MEKKRLIIILTAVFICNCGQSGNNNLSDAALQFDANDTVEIWMCRSEDEVKCSDGVFYHCTREGEFLVTLKEDCHQQGLLCIENPPIGCALCRPGQLRCEGENVMKCSNDGKSWEHVKTCDSSKGEICIHGTCINGCEDAKRWKSNVGCSYWAVDLDNAVAEADASAQQFAIVVSNLTGIHAHVTVERNDAPFGEEPEITVVEERIIAPHTLDVIELDRREVDGSSQSGQNDGTGSAITSNAYHIVSTVPIIVYQFNPLANVDVFSNDASILIPDTACGTKYTVLGWPQTIARTGNPDTDMKNDLRSFITIVGTDYETRVKIRLPLDEKLKVLGDGNFIPYMIGGDSFEITIGPFDVINLETDGFMAEFTGTIIDSSKPVVVFSGSEASDVPTFEDLSTRLCCADHLEQQLFAYDRNGRKYVAALTPSRTSAVKLAGGDVTPHEENEYFKILSLFDTTTIKTTLPSPLESFTLNSGRSIVIEVTKDFLIESDKPISVGQFVASQNATGIPKELPGGDPAFILLPPVEQWRENYTFLTPSLYAFDFIIITHPPNANIMLDGKPLPPTCRTKPVEGAESEFEVTRCQLSFPEVVEGVRPNNILPGEQNDGVHKIYSDVPVGLIVYGFDNYVSYGYPGGTDLRIIE